MKTTMKHLSLVLIASLGFIACGQESGFKDKPVSAQQPAKDANKSKDFVEDEADAEAIAAEVPQGGYGSSPEKIAAARQEQCTSQGGKWDGSNCQFASGQAPRQATASGTSRPSSAYTTARTIGTVIGVLTSIPSGGGGGGGGGSGGGCSSCGCY